MNLNFFLRYSFSELFLAQVTILYIVLNHTQSSLDFSPYIYVL